MRGLFFATQLACACAYNAVTAPPTLQHRTVATRAVAAVRMQEEGSSSSSGLVKGLWRQIVGNSEADEAAAVQRDLNPTMSDELEYVPLVLVVGAAGRTGRLIVRKLVMQGFRVAVLVRSLGSDTLNLLGSGVTYSYGDMTDYRALLDAMEDVDRVIFAADCEGDEEKELLGLQQVLRSFQDTRTFMYGDAEATKLTLLKMRRDSDFNRWQVEDSASEAGFRLAAAGIGPQPSIAYWKRSPTRAHNNGVFVGKVFDTYLGSAAVSCSLSGLLLGGSPVLSEDGPLLSDSARPAVAAAAEGEAADGTAGKQAASATMAAAAAAEAAAGDEAAAAAAAELNRAAAAMAAAEVPLDLGEYSGVNVRVLGDGKKYTCVLRTPAHKDDGLEYHADFETTTTAFKTVRLPFSNFVAVRGGRPVKGAPELDRRRIVGMALAFYPQRNDPDTTTGEFYLSLSNVKAYRKRDEPEFVYLSDAGVGPLHASTAKAREAALAAAAEAAAASAATQAEEAEASSVPAVAAAIKASEIAARKASAEAAVLDPDAAGEGAQLEGMAAEERRAHIKRRGELMLRASGLTYFIVRAAELDERPSGARRLAFTQGTGKVRGSVPRADVAEVVVRSLLDPRACNVACTVSEEAAAAPSGFEQDISKALEVLEPNKF